MPNSIEDFIHRTGRTGRAGKTGTAVSFFDPGSSSTSLLYLEREGTLI